MIVAFVGCYKLSSWRHRSLVINAEQSRREHVILSHASQEKHFGTIVLGDGITEVAYLPPLCGDLVLNAGVGSYFLAQSTALLKRLLPITSADRMTLIAGLNDAHMTEPRDPIKFGREYGAYVDLAKTQGGQVLLGTVGPAAKRMDYDTAFIDQINGAIRQATKSHGLMLIDFNAALAGPDGAMAGTDTLDGAHLTASGYAKWRGALEGVACRPKTHAGPP
jgi:lysophospholipase L1-like esterase